MCGRRTCVSICRKQRKRLRLVIGRLGSYRATSGNPTRWPTTFRLRPNDARLISSASMTDAFVWLDEATLVNLDAVAYIQIESQEARISFNGEKLTISAQHLPRFQEYLRNRFKNEARPVRATGSTKMV